MVQFLQRRFNAQLVIIVCRTLDRTSHAILAHTILILSRLLHLIVRIALQAPPVTLEDKSIMTRNSNVKPVIIAQMLRIRSSAPKVTTVRKIKPHQHHALQAITPMFWLNPNVCNVQQDSTVVMIKSLPLPPQTVIVLKFLLTVKLHVWLVSIVLKDHILTQQLH